MENISALRLKHFLILIYCLNDRSIWIECLILNSHRSPISIKLLITAVRWDSEPFSNYFLPGKLCVYLIMLLISMQMFSFQLILKLSLVDCNYTLP